MASLFLLIAIVIYWSAQRQACKTLERSSNNDAETIPTKNFRRLAILLSVATIATGAILWGL